MPIVCNPTAITTRRGDVQCGIPGTGSAHGLGSDPDLPAPGPIRSVRNQSDQTGSDATSLIVDGILWRVFTAPPDFKYFLTVKNAAGPIVPAEQGAFAFNSSGFPLTPTGADRPDPTKQQSPGKLTASKGWGIHTGMNSPTMSSSYSYFKIARHADRRPLAGDHSVRLGDPVHGDRRQGPYPVGLHGNRGPCH